MSAMGVVNAMDGLFLAAAETAAINSAMRRVHQNATQDGLNAVATVGQALQFERQAHARTCAALRDVQADLASERARADRAEQLLRQLAQAGVI